MSENLGDRNINPTKLSIQHKFMFISHKVFSKSIWFHNFNLDL